MTAFLSSCSRARPTSSMPQRRSRPARRPSVVQSMSSKPVRGTAAIPWLETFRMAKELGEVSIQACSGSLETLGVDASRLDPLVDGPCGIAAFLVAAEGGQLLFI